MIKKNEMAISRIADITKNVTTKEYIEFCLKKSDGIIGYYDDVTNNEVIFISSRYIPEFLYNNSYLSGVTITTQRIDNYIQKINSLNDEDKLDLILDGKFSDKLTNLINSIQPKFDNLIQDVEDLYYDVLNFNENMGFDVNKDNIKLDQNFRPKNGELFLCELNEDDKLILSNVKTREFLKWWPFVNVLRGVTNFVDYKRDAKKCCIDIYKNKYFILSFFSRSLFRIEYTVPESYTIDQVVNEFVKTGLFVSDGIDNRMRYFCCNLKQDLTKIENVDYSYTLTIEITYYRDGRVICHIKAD